ncbi:hypothetical protein LTR66_013706, partial [Elasticomyces elasticus]
QEAEQAFSLGSATSADFRLSSDLKLVLLDFDLKRKRQEFDNGTYDCGICLEPKKGRFGEITTLTGKKRKRDLSLNPSELLQIPIEQDKVQRYVHLKRKKKLESDKNTVYCPRAWCGGAAKSPNHPKSGDPSHEADEELSDAEDATTRTTSKKNLATVEDTRLQVCEDCNYAFCSLCGKGWHGSYLACKPRSTKELNDEEKASQDYLTKYSTPCPTCNAPAQKSMGCNHMICFKCKTHFCYLCSAYLMPDNPYMHFNTVKSPCYMRLWELEGGDGADVGIGFAGGDNFRHDEPDVPWEADPDLLDSGSEDGTEDELSDGDFVEFGGDEPIDWDDDSEGEQAAPDQRLPDRPHIEIVVGGRNVRVELPQQVAAPAVPPPAPNAPRGRNRGRGGAQANARGARNQGRGGRAPAPPQQARPANPIPPEARRAAPAIQQQQNRAAVQALNDIVERQQEEVIAPAVNAAPGQGNNVDGALHRFLQLAVEDREDEWDSDEDEHPAAGVHNVQAQQRARNRPRRR